MKVARGWKVAAAVLVGALVVAARPSQDGLYGVDDSRRPVYRGIQRMRESKSDAEVIVKSDISVMGPEDSRAVNLKPTSATPIGESLKMVTNQLLQAPTATDMVATDVRTPPRVKSQHRIDESLHGKGEAIPVIMGSKASYEVSSTTQKAATLSPDGLSTWVLLTNGEQSTLATKKKPGASVGDSSKKQSSVTTAENIKKLNDSFKLERKPTPKPSQNLSKKQNVTKDELSKTSSLTLHDSKFKNRTPVIVGRIPATPKNKTDGPANKKNTTQTKHEDLTSKVKSTTPTSTSISTATQKNTVYIPDIVPTTSLVIETDTVDSGDDNATTESPSTTTKHTRRPVTKKKKKNKNRRRRPSTKPDTTEIESKITPENNSNNSKIENHPNRPLSTRIYNYLAREVMPNVGVGLVGLFLTAGLAGLLLYPFGGGIARRNYEKVSGPSPDAHMYYYNDYTPGVDVDQGNVQPEETVFGQVLSGMNQNNYGNRYDSHKYSSNKYRYDSHDYNAANVNGYAGSEYSTLPDSLKHRDYSTLPDNTKYYNMEPMSPQYKTSEDLGEMDKYAEENKYPSLTEYTAYNNAASVGTSGTYESIRNNNQSELNEEDKSDKSQPQFSALVGSPQFNDYVGSVSVSGGYGADIRHRSGSASLEHGPRSLEVKSRKVRSAGEILDNEIDDSDRYSSSPTTVKYENNNEGNVKSTMIKNSAENIEVTTPHPESTTLKDQEEFSFIDLFRRVAQAKLKLGISLLRSTSEAFQQYLQRLTLKMETAVRHLERNRTHPNINHNAPIRRMKRQVKISKKKKHITRKQKQN